MYRIYTEKTVDEAVAKGLHELGVTEDDIKIEVLDGGSSGFLGFGKRTAEVKLSIINPELKSHGSIEALIASGIETSNEQQKDEPLVEEKVNEVQLPESDETTIADNGDDYKEETVEEIEIIQSESVEDDTPVEHVTDKAPIKQAAEDTAAYISNVVREMNIPNEVEVHLKDTTVTIEFHSELAAKIIGKRGQTLNALQELGQNYFNTIYKSYGKVFLDVEEYRAKRRDTLESLAVNMSKKAMRTEEPIKMEPMPSFERKTMHHVLSRMSHIETYSEGREPNRYVVITKK